MTITNTEAQGLVDEYYTPNERVQEKLVEIYEDIKYEAKAGNLTIDVGAGGLSNQEMDYVCHVFARDGFSCNYTGTDGHAPFFIITIKP